MPGMKRLKTGVGIRGRKCMALSNSNLDVELTRATASEEIPDTLLRFLPLLPCDILFQSGIKLLLGGSHQLHPVLSDNPIEGGKLAVWMRQLNLPMLPETDRSVSQNHSGPIREIEDKIRAHAGLIADVMLTGEQEEDDGDIAVNE